MRTSLPEILFFVSVASIVVALGLSGGSLSKSVKWNLYNSITIYCDASFGISKKLYAYQTLWATYDEFDNDKSAYGIVLVAIKTDSWRILARILVIASLGVGFLTLCTLIGTKVPILKEKPCALNAVRIVSSLTSAGNCALLIYTLYYYHMHYPLMRHNNFIDPTSCYPDEDNVSTGFYMTAFASFLYFTSVVLNVLNMTNLVQNNNAANVAPIV